MSVKSKYDYTSVDQVFVSVQFGQLALESSLIEHTTFSSVGYSVGLLKDFALVPNSRFSYALGLVYHSQDYVSNMHLYYNSNIDKYKLSFSQDPTYPISSNVLNLKSVDFITELRFRTIEHYSDNDFFRFHVGLQVGYVFSFKSTYTYKGIQRSDIDISDLITPYVYGLRFTVGYGLINVFYYYGLSNIFKNSNNLQLQDVNSVSQLDNHQSFGIQMYLL